MFHLQDYLHTALSIVLENFTLTAIPPSKHTTTPQTYSTTSDSPIHISQPIRTKMSNANTTATTTTNRQQSLTGTCTRYKVLSDQSRFHAFKSTNKTRCDNHLSGWYRFMFNAGNRMLDSCPSSQHTSAFQCGADWQGWLNGLHPNENEGEANRTVCFSTNNNCTCDYEQTIKVRNCGQYYVYLLNGVPACNQRYCGARG